MASISIGLLAEFPFSRNIGRASWCDNNFDCAFGRCFNDVRALLGRGRCDETLDRIRFVAIVLSETRQYNL